MRFDNLQDWLSWQEGLHPSEIELGLERINQVWKRLHPGDLKPIVISVAGTNGKGSCCAMLESILTGAGYKTGCYTSPHLLKYNERIRVQANPVDDKSLCEAFAAVDDARADISITYFEFGTLAALYLFARSNLDVVILEVGLGGRLDAVNIIDADVALLTSVGLDHTDWLGDDVESIGREKAGIFRSGRPAVCAQFLPPDSVVKYARDIGANFFCQGHDFSFNIEDRAWSWKGAQGMVRAGLPQPALRGSQQIQNASAVLMVLECLSMQLPVQQAHIKQGLSAVALPGRFQIIPADINLILDVAHNQQAFEVLAQNLKEYDCQGRIHIVLGMLEDKDVESAALLAPFVNQWFTGTLDLHRGLGADQLSARLKDAGVSGIIQNDSIKKALQRARSMATTGDTILICGSFMTVAAAMQAE